MIKLEHVILPSPEQMEFAIEGMRNPMNSWEKSDSEFGFFYDHPDDYEPVPRSYIGSNDLALMQKLSAAGTDHRKFMRMMPVMVRITAPLYWWKEFDTYKVGTVANSCSTMHKITEKEFTLEDFSCEHLISVCGDERIYTTYPNSEGGYDDWCPSQILDLTIDALNQIRQLYLNKIKDKNTTLLAEKDIWWQMIQLLPSSYNQTRNVMLNYEVLTNIYHSRKNHKLDEWRELCSWIETLPYSELITGENV